MVVAYRYAVGFGGVRFRYFNFGWVPVWTRKVWILLGVIPKGQIISLIFIFFLILSGGLFDLAESKQEVAFRYAVERVNANRKILSQSLLSAIIEKIPPQDSFHASKRGKLTLF